MGLTDDILTWESMRALASGEVLTAGLDILVVTADPKRPPIKWPHQRHWLSASTPMVPKAGDILYARKGWCDPWRHKLVQEVTAPVVLVTTFYDPSIKTQATDVMFQPGSSIARWFGVQVATTHPQLTAMPVGVEGSVVPFLQRGELQDNRDITLYCNFQFGHLLPAQRHREDLWRHFSAKPWVTVESWGQRMAHYVAQLGRSRFVLSPPGWGWDCYRTYEAIAMGAIPIVLRNPPFTDVCEGLPILFVDDWTEVTPERLAHEWEVRAPGNTATMTRSYWTQRIQASASAAAQRLVVAS